MLADELDAAKFDVVHLDTEAHMLRPGWLPKPLHHLLRKRWLSKRCASYQHSQKYLTWLHVPPGALQVAARTSVPAKLCLRFESGRCCAWGVPMATYDELAAAFDMLQAPSCARLPS